MVAFLVFNATLYAGQICLYLLYFFWSSSVYFLNVIYITLATLNLAVRWTFRATVRGRCASLTGVTTLQVPFLLFACWLWLNCAFSGFPFKSVADREKWDKVCVCGFVCLCVCVSVCLCVWRVLHVCVCVRARREGLGHSPRESYARCIHLLPR